MPKFIPKTILPSVSPKEMVDHINDLTINLNTLFGASSSVVARLRESKLIENIAFGSGHKPSSFSIEAPAKVFYPNNPGISITSHTGYLVTHGLGRIPKWIHLNPDIVSYSTGGAGTNILTQIKPTGDDLWINAGTALVPSYKTFPLDLTKQIVFSWLGSTTNPRFDILFF